MKFVLYGRYDPTTYVIAYMATDIKGCDFNYLELDCDPVLIAFGDGREISRTGDMARVEDWVNGLVFGEETP
nr:MAG TPA: hypothetical protein [Caudoviricetes sp.]